MNVENVWNTRNGKGTRQRNGKRYAKRAKGKRAKREAAKVIEAAAMMKGGCKGCKEQKRAAAQCCKCTEKEHAPIYRLHTKTMYAHKYTYIVRIE